MRKMAICCVCLLIMILAVSVYINYNKNMQQNNVVINETSETVVDEFTSNMELYDTTYQENSISNLYEVESYKENDEILYKYMLTDLNGNIVYQEDELYKEPTIRELEDELIKITVGAGTEVILTRYYDSVSGEVSDVYITPFDEYKNKLIRFETKKIIIQDIFNKNGHYKEIEIDTSDSADPTTVIRSAKFIDDSTVEVTYLTGKDYKEVKERFKY